MSRLFDAYVMVDYSAAEGKKVGDSSVWIGVVKRDVRFRLSYECFNPETRALALEQLKTLLADLHRRGDRVLLGFDFALGFPRGTVKKLALETTTPWQSMWQFLSKNIVDKPDNSNNRFAVAAKMNRLMTDQAYPFWGCPKSAAQKWLSTLKPESIGDFPEHRLTESYIREKKARIGQKPAQAKSQWQMHGAGVVGGQSMLGITMVQKLLQTLGDKAQVWPFQMGFAALTVDGLAPFSTVLTEIYPSLFEIVPEYNEVKDAAQVRTVAHKMAELDDRGELAALFDAPTLSQDDLLIALQEEGWVLGA